MQDITFKKIISEPVWWLLLSTIIIMFTVKTNAPDLTVATVIPLGLGWFIATLIVGRIQKNC